MNNITMLQSFHWYTPDDGNFWNFCSEQAERWAHLGFTHVWLPPAYKSSQGTHEPGYAVYDLFDLGEFDQHGSVRTKYGTKEEYLACIKELQKRNIKVIADVVLNHKHGGDEKEKFPAREVLFENRTKFAGDEKEIEAYTKFFFPGRNGKYSDFVWDWKTFSGVDEFRDNQVKIYKILNEYGDQWEEIIDYQFGNFDYLMGADIEFRNEHVRNELKWWGKWYYETSGVDGFRLDAVKHIAPYFYMEWIDFLKKECGRDFFIMAEYWHRDVDFLIKYYETMHGRTRLVDAPLHYNLAEASRQGNKYDMRTIFNDSFLQYKPEASITFVDNHDTQPLQALESPVDYWFKPLAFSLILLREQGIPCVFLPALKGAEYSDEKDGKTININLAGVPDLDALLLCRKYLSYGKQREFIDHANTIGWTREGVDEMEHSGLAVLMTNGSEGEKHMEVGQKHAGSTFVDITGNRPDKIAINKEGWGHFFVNGGSVSVYVKEASLKKFH